MEFNPELLEIPTFRAADNGRNSKDVDSKAEDDSALIVDNQDFFAFPEVVKDSCTPSQYVDSRGRSSVAGRRHNV